MFNRRTTQTSQSVVERLQEITKNAKEEYLPSFSPDNIMVGVTKAAVEAAERGLYCAEYVFMPPVGSFDLEVVRTDLLRRLAANYPSARIYVSGDNEAGDLDNQLYAGVWVVCVSWRPEPKNE